jgi:hypothetical protein
LEEDEVEQERMETAPVTRVTIPFSSGMGQELFSSTAPQERAVDAANKSVPETLLGCYHLH